VYQTPILHMGIDSLLVVRILNRFLRTLKNKYRNAVEAKSEFSPGNLLSSLNVKDFVRKLRKDGFLEEEHSCLEVKQSVELLTEASFFYEYSLPMKIESISQELAESIMSKLKEELEDPNQKISF